MSRDRATLAGAAGPIEIERDVDGVAVISAADSADMLFGLGYCHARDRGLQMRFLRILARGEASVRLWDSDEMLALDRFFLRLNFNGDSAAQEAVTSPRAKAGVDAYCRGVDLGFARHGVPWELGLFGDRAEGDPWTFADIYLTAKVIGYVSLAMSQADLEHWIVECVQNGVSRDQLEELFPGRLEGLDVELLRQVRLGEQIVPEELWNTAVLPLAMASNNWVLAGSKTASGAPFVCSDPHLQVDRLPPFWYEAICRWPSEGAPRYAVGATLPGTPGIVVGRNPDLAWSVTFAFMDCTDSWIEECRDGRYRRGREWVPFTVREATLRRRSQPPLVLRFYENEHGTLEGDPHVPGYYLASRWSCGEETGAASLDGLLGILEARTVEQGRRLLGQVTNSSWNWLLGDREGNIGYQMAGKLPLRKAGASGLVPLPGWDPENDWQGFAPLEELPRAFNPPEGFLATANDDLNGLGVRAPINLGVPPYRAQRIRAVLSRRGTFTIEDMKALQFDVVSLQAEQFLVLLKPLLHEFVPTENTRLLLAWDGSYDADSRAATLFERFYRALIVEVFGNSPPMENGHRGLGASVVAHMIDHTSLLGEFYGVFDRLLLAPESLWFGNRTRAEVYKTVLAGVLGTPARPYGETRQIVLQQILLGGKLPRFLGFDRGPVPLRGGRATVHQGQLLRNRGRLLASGPSYRFVTDLSTDDMHTTLPGGASDRRFSRWYATGLAEWLKGDYKVLHGLAAHSDQPGDVRSGNDPRRNGR